MEVATAVGTADMAGNLSVISYKFCVVSSTHKGTDAVRLGLGPEVFSGLRPLPFAADPLTPAKRQSYLFVRQSPCIRGRPRTRRAP